MRKLLSLPVIALAAFFLGTLVYEGVSQITVPNTFTPGQTITAASMNANFSAVADNALNRATGGTITGNVAVSNGVTIDGVDISVADAANLKKAGGTMTGNLLFTDASYDIGASGATRPRDLYLSRNAVIGGTLSAAGTTVATLNTSSGSTASTASATPVTLFALPASDYAIYLVFAYLSVNDAGNYGAVSLVTQLGTTPKITALQTASLMTISLSGGNVQATQTSGSPAVIGYVMVKVK